MATAPKTYFKLYFASKPDPDKGELGANYSQMAPTQSNEDWFKGTMVTTVYSSLLIDPITMQVLLDDTQGFPPRRERLLKATAQ